MKLKEGEYKRHMKIEINTKSADKYEVEELTKYLESGLWEYKTYWNE